MSFTPKPKYQGHQASADATRAVTSSGPKLTSKASKYLGGSLLQPRFTAAEDEQAYRGSIERKALEADSTARARRKKS
jgi:hypothetical protein